MELEYITDYNNEYPNDSIFVLKNFTKSELEKLYEEINQLVKTKEDVTITNSNYIKNLSDKILILTIGEENTGIKNIKNNIYHCILKQKQYIEIQNMIQSYVIENTIGYYWLYDVHNEIDFLLSNSGKW
jgi:hypothetical protein